MIKSFLIRMIQYVKLIYNSKELSKSATFIIIGIAILLFEIFSVDIQSEGELTEIKATFYSGRLNRYTTSRHVEESEYIINLYGYKNDFVISNRLIDFFSRSNFEIFVKTGDPVFVHISNKDKQKLNVYGKIFVYGISSYRTVYLDYRKEIEMNKGHAFIYASLIFILIGIGMFYYYRDKLILDEDRYFKLNKKSTWST